MMMHRFLLVLTAITVLPSLTGCSAGPRPPRISGGGATFVDPIMQKWSAEYLSA